MSKVLTLDNFWTRRLKVKAPDGLGAVRGWSLEKCGLPTFKEAPLSIDEDLSSEGQEETSPVLLVSAPGAVGKSTLARQIAYITGAVYVDLSKADPVGGNTLSGGLVKSGLYSAWEDGSTAVLIDGIDEARFRVTQEAFEAFVSDISQLTKGRVIPTILFGRTVAIQDTWLLLDSNGTQSAVLEIGFYGQEASVDFAEAQLRAARPRSPYAQAERRAIELLLSKLREQTESDGDRFAGYAPVLRAVSERVAGVGNPAALIGEIEKGERPVTLPKVVSAILERERGKLAGLSFEDPTLASRLYSDTEQLDRLVARLYKLAPPPLPPMSPRDAQTYSTALDSWVPEHPFLGGQQGTSSAVFEAFITVHALRSKSASQPAVQAELLRGAAANPFLAEFYVNEEDNGESIFLPPEHIGILYASLRARLSLGDSASLSISSPEDAQDEQVLRADVEITLARKDAERPRILNFESDQTGGLKLGRYLEDIEIDAPHAKVEIGPGPEAILVAPISIQCGELQFTTEKVIAESSMGREDASVYLEAQVYDGAQIVSVPTVRGNVKFSCSWPGDKNHPWTNFASAPTAAEDPKTDEALRRFRKFIISFRSHSKGSLARYQHKLEHARMTKGLGAAVLALLKNEKILTLDRSKAMYFLDPDRLGSLAGATYADCMARKFDDKTIKFVKQAL